MSDPVRIGSIEAEARIGIATGALGFTGLVQFATMPNADALKPLQWAAAACFLAAFLAGFVGYFWMSTTAELGERAAVGWRKHAIRALRSAASVVMLLSVAALLHAVAFVASHVLPDGADTLWPYGVVAGALIATLFYLHAVLAAAGTLPEPDEPPASPLARRPAAVRLKRARARRGR